MTHTSESSPNDPEPAAAELRSLLGTLRELLPPGKKKIDTPVAEEVSRKVNLLAVHLPKTPDEAEALRCLALIGVAIARGSKDAAKRKPRPARWSQNRPAPLTTLQHADERAAALGLLTALKADWAAPYALDEAVDPDTDKTLFTALIKWAVNASLTQSAFIEHLARVLEAGPPRTIDRIQQVLKTASKELAATDIEAGPTLPDAYLALANAITRICQRNETAPKTTAALQVQVLVLLDVVTSRDPAVLFEPLTAQALVALSAPLGGWAKTASKPLAALARRMVSLSIHHARLRGVDDAADVRHLLQHAASILPIDKVASRFVSARDLIKQIRTPVPEDATRGAPGTTIAAAGLQEQLGALLVAWDVLHDGVSDPATGREVAALIELVARKANVERVGTHGEIVPFQPLQHYLAAPSPTPPSQVRIEVPGVRAMRNDGSYRLLTRAVVWPIP
ncbi:MAG: hypothetical protein K2W80_02520 [Burkholderiales bacterium]|nr:hypothetical protein [Burkholderiales bacterium]